MVHGPVLRVIVIVNLGQVRGRCSRWDDAHGLLSWLIYDVLRSPDPETN